jgi:hypothetical protein
LAGERGDRRCTLLDPLSEPVGREELLRRERSPHAIGAVEAPQAPGDPFEVAYGPGAQSIVDVFEPQDGHFVS